MPTAKEMLQARRSALIVERDGHVATKTQAQNRIAERAAQLDARLAEIEAELDRKIAILDKEIVDIDQAVVDLV